MNKISFKDLVQEEVKKPAKAEPLWTPIDPPVQEEKKVEYKALKPRNGIKSLLDFNEDIKPVKAVATAPKIPLEPKIEEASVLEEELVQEIRLPEPIIEPVITLADRAVDHITKEVKLEEQNDSYQQPSSLVDVRSFNDVKKKIQFLQDWISKISLAGPGSGSYWLYDLGDTNYDLVKNPSNNDVLTYNSANLKWEVGAVNNALGTRYHGSYFSNVNQTSANTNNSYFVTVNNTDFQSGFTTDGANLIATYSGVYNLQFSGQLHYNGGGGTGKTVEIWLTKNGANVPDTNTRVDIASASPFVVAAWNFLVPLSAGDKTALKWSTNNLQIGFDASSGTNGPNVPSIILTIVQV